MNVTNYFGLSVVVERFHRLFLDVVNQELSSLGIRDINSVQAVILYQVGQGTQPISVNEIYRRGYYMGSNVSYNLRKLIISGYFYKLDFPEDKRCVYVALSEKGKELYERLDELFKSHTGTLEQCGVDDKLMTNLNNKIKSVGEILKVIKE